MLTLHNIINHFHIKRSHTVNCELRDKQMQMGALDVNKLAMIGSLLSTVKQEDAYLA